MTLPLKLRRVAQAEYDDAVDWYEEHRPGLGAQFLAALRQRLDDIANSPERYPEVWPGVREAALTGWPYCVYYQVHPNHVLVIAVFHRARSLNLAVPRLTA